MPDIKADEQVLQQHYLKCYETVKSDRFFAIYAQEKIRHSWQVVGAGNYIMRHETDFHNRNADFLRYAKLAYLFHDIGRFKEITLSFANPGQQYDHGLFGYEILKSMPEYAVPEILLPVKHHGRMIEELYSDPDFADIDDLKLRSDIEKIIFLVRDADKIANFNLLRNSVKKADTHIFDLFMCGLPDAELSSQTVEDFKDIQIVRKKDIASVADNLLYYLSWTFDMNYKSSFDFCIKTGSFKTLFEVLNNYNPDKKLQKELEKNFQNYIEYRYQQFKG